MSTFDTTTAFRSEKLTAAEKTAITEVMDTVKHLHKLAEDARPTNSVEHRKAKDAAHEVMRSNPTPATINAYKAALGNYLNPDAIFEPVHALLDHLIGEELKKVVPVAQRIHAAVTSAAKDPKFFGVEKINSISDLAERGEALTDFAAKHKATIVALNDEAATLDNERTAHHWLARHGFCEVIWG